MSIAWPLSEGENIILVESIDAAGNMATVSITVTRDSIPPHLFVLAPRDGLLTGDLTTLVTGDIEPGVDAWLVVLFNGGTIHVLGTADTDCLLFLNGVPVENDGLIDRTLMLDEGTTIIELHAVDPAGNIGVSRISVNMDTMRPVIDLVKPILDRVRTTNPVLEIAGRIQGECQMLTVMDEDVTVSEGAFSKTVTLTSEGLNRITVRATDAAGNFDEKMVFVEVSWTEPQLTVEFTTDGDPAKSTNGTVLIVGTAIGNISVVNVIHNGTSGDRVQTYLVGGSGDFTIAFDLEKGQNTLVVRAIDSFGNSDETDLYTVEYTPSTGSSDEGGKTELLDVGIVVLGFGIALLTMVFIAGWLHNRYHA